MKASSELLTVEEAAELLNLNPKTVYNRNGGTGHLSRIKMGRSVRLLRSEVEEHRDQLIDAAVAVRNKIYGD